MKKVSKIGSRVATACAYIGFSVLFSLSGIAVAERWSSETLTVAVATTGAIAVWGLWRSVPLRKIGRAFFAPVKAKERRKRKWKIMNFILPKPRKE